MFTQEEWVRYGDELRRPLHIAEDLPKSDKVFVVGAGLSGLTIAYRIASKRPDVSVVLLEKDHGYGGTIETWQQDEWLCDVAVNAARPHPAFWRLVEDLGLASTFLPSNPSASTRWISSGGKTTKLTPWSVLRKGPFKLLRGVRTGRKGKMSVAEIFPFPGIADAMTLGIVNDVSANVDADFLMPSITRFGASPPQKWSTIKRRMQRTYPLFAPEPGSTASFVGGMQTLVDGLVERLGQLDNVEVTFGAEVDSPHALAEAKGVPVSSVVWCAPLGRPPEHFTHLDVYAVGYTNADTANVAAGYGTLIPDPTSPISGILHESDVHASPRAPAGHRLFRLMAPHARKATEASVKATLKKVLCEAEPVMFEKIGERRIPCYPSGYMASLEVSQPAFTRAGWFYSGVSVTHVVAEAERIVARF